LLAVRADGRPFVDWATVLDRTAVRIRARYDAGFGHVHPHMLRHSFAMHTLERLVRGYYQQAAKLVVDTGGDDALALYLTKADPLLVLFALDRTGPRPHKTRRASANPPRPPTEQ
jgi:integrase